LLRVISCTITVYIHNIYEGIITEINNIMLGGNIPLITSRVIVVVSSRDVVDAAHLYYCISLFLSTSLTNMFLLFVRNKCNKCLHSLLCWLKVYSELKKHKEAQFHIKMAIRHLQLELFGRVLGTFEDPTEVEMKNDSVEEGRVITYGVALFNLAVQLEFLGKWEQSMDSYDKASTFARFHNLPDQIRQTIKNARTAAYPKLQRKISKEKNIVHVREQREMALTISRARTPMSKKRLQTASKAKRSPSNITVDIEAKLRQWSMYDKASRK